MNTDTDYYDVNKLLINAKKNQQLLDDIKIMNKTLEDTYLNLKLKLSVRIEELKTLNNDHQNIAEMYNAIIKICSE